MKFRRVAVRHTDHPNGAVFVQLPRRLWRSAGKCMCLVCGGREGFWDTLAISPRGYPYYTVHYPRMLKRSVFDPTVVRVPVPLNFEGGLRFARDLRKR